MIRRKRLVAEFFVVMLGVLAALGVDTMVGAIRDVLRAQDYRERLSEDLGADAYALRSAWAHYSRTVEYGLRALDVLEDDGVRSAPDQDLLSIYLAANVGAAALQTSTWDDLISSGSLPLLDSDLRRDVSSYYRDFVSGPTSWELPLEYRERVRGLVPPAIAERLSHADCIFTGIIGRAADVHPDPTPPECTTRVDAEEAQGLIDLLRAEPGLIRDLTLRISETRTMAFQFQVLADSAEVLAARVGT